MAKDYSNLKDKKTRKAIHGYVINMPKRKQASRELQLLRIVLSAQETRIDFGYRAQGENTGYDFLEGKSKVYLYSKEKNKKWELQDLSNFKTAASNSWFFFTLHFPSLLKDLDFTTSSIFDLRSQQALSYIDLIFNEKEGLQVHQIALNESSSISELSED